MNIKIRKIEDNGKHSDERLILDVLKDDDIGTYLVLDTTYLANGKISNKVRHPYWFPDKPVKAGDVVVLYTKQGVQTAQKNVNGSTTHFFYWGMDNSVWNNDTDCAVLIKIKEFDTKRK